MTAPGRFISFEGIDGAGKSTQLQALAGAFRAAGRRVVVTREPGGTVLAEALRELVLNRPMDALTEALLLFGARRDHVCSVIEPAISRGDVVLCDRFSDASFAYQGGGRAFDWGVLATLERWVQTPSDATSAGRRRGLVRPDLTLWLDLDPALAAARVTGVRDRFEREPRAFFEAVRAGYQRRAVEDPARIVHIDAGRPPVEVAAAVRSAVQGSGWL